MRIGADRDDVRRRLDDRRCERMLVDTEGNELDPRRLAVRVQERTELRGLVLAVGEHDRGRRQRSRIQRRACAANEAVPSRSGSPIATYTNGGRTLPALLSSISGIPTVSTVESTTSARLAVLNDASTVAKSPP